MSADFPVVTRYEVRGAEDVLATNEKLWQSFQEGDVSAKEFGKSLKQSMEPLQAEARLLNATRMALRVESAEFLQFGRVLGSVGSIGRNLVSMWQAYTIGQIRVAQTTENVEKAQLGVAVAHRKVQDAEKEVGKWQKIYNQYLQDFGSESAYTKDAYDNLTRAQEYLADAQHGEVDANADLKRAIEENTRALENLKLGYVSIGLQSVSTVADLIRITTALSTFFALIEAKGGIVTALASSVGSLSTAFGGLGLTLASIATPFGIILATSKDAQEQTASFLNQLATLPERIGKEAETHPWWHWIPFAGLFEPNEQPAPAPYTPPTTTTMPYKKYKWLQTGTPYVPETGLYGLHKGERVLTERESRTLKQTGGNNFKVTLNVYPPPNTTDPEAIAQYTLEKMKKWFATGIAM